MMTNWLIKKFIKDPDNSQTFQVRSAYGKLAGFVGIVCNLLLAVLKGVVALASGSVAIMADAVNNLSDMGSGIVSIAGFKLSEKPADKEHPFGHARYEYLAGLVVAVLVLVIGIELARASINKLINPTEVEYSLVSLLILVFSILIKLWLTFFYRKIGGFIQSQTLTASADDSRNDVISTSAVLLSAIISRLFQINLDGWMGLGVAIFILWSGYLLVRETLDPLLGTAPDPVLVEKIRTQILSYPGVLGTHDLLLHDYGPGRRFASVHVELAAEVDVMLSHELVDRIERDFLKEDNLFLIIHMDPIITDDPELTDLRLWLSGEVKQIHPELTIHDVRMVKDKKLRHVIFDCVKPESLDMSDDRLQDCLREIVTKKHPDYDCVITIDESFAPVIK